MKTFCEACVHFLCAAIGKIAGEQIVKLRTLGLTEEQAENEIVQGFLS